MNLAIILLAATVYFAYAVDLKRLRTAKSKTRWSVYLILFIGGMVLTTLYSYHLGMPPVPLNRLK